MWRTMECVVNPEEVQIFISCRPGGGFASQDLRESAVLGYALYSYNMHFQACLNLNIFESVAYIRARGADTSGLFLESV
jgi:hypothetical protein